MRYFVEGRWFDDFTHAVTFAQRIAEEMKRPVDLQRDHGCGHLWTATMRPVEKAA